jgi:hypothetical protein
MPGSGVEATKALISTAESARHSDQARNMDLMKTNYDAFIAELATRAAKL